MVFAAAAAAAATDNEDDDDDDDDNNTANSDALESLLEFNTSSFASEENEK